MNESNTSLVNFEKPPITEVALSVQFEPIEGLHSTMLGLMWGEVFRDNFPKVQQHAAISNTIELKGIRRSFQNNQFKIPLLENVPSRTWLINEDETELIQIQQDRFIFNWRKIEGDEKYPRYPLLKKNFQENLSLFLNFIKDNKLGDFIPNQCDVTYINHIHNGDVWKSHDELNKVVSIWSDEYSEQFPLEAEDYQFLNKYIINDDSGEFLGRLHINLQPAFTKNDDRPLFSMTLTARGRPDGEGLDGVLKFFDVGRDYIVKGFTAITTPAMHKIWGRKHAK